MADAQLLDWSTVPMEEMNPLIRRQVIHGEKATVARIFLAVGAVVPEHSHENEQVSMIIEGSLKFVVAGREQVVRAGQVLHLPAFVPHSAVAEEDCLAIDIFSPRREDWIRGDDAYLRGSK
jgi:quercetin dioxygenase-like cupin family protein